MPQRFISPSYESAPVDDFRFNVVPRQGGKLIACPWWRFVDRVEPVDESCPPRRISRLFQEHFTFRDRQPAGNCYVVRGLSGDFEWPFVVGVFSAAGWRWFAFERRFTKPLPNEVRLLFALAETGAFDPPPPASPTRIGLPNGTPDATVALAG